MAAIVLWFYVEDSQGVFNIQAQQHCQHPVWSSEKDFSSI